MKIFVCDDFNVYKDGEFYSIYGSWGRGIFPREKNDKPYTLKELIRAAIKFGYPMPIVNFLIDVDKGRANLEILEYA